jgi:lipopolysaccharide transport system ATP-binding protein
MSGTPAQEPAIRVVDLGKRFEMAAGPSQGHLRDRIGNAMRREKPEDGTTSPTTWALRHIDLEVPQGQIFGVIGRNGSGKTTLLSVLAKVTTPTEGKAFIRGRVVPLLAVGTGFHPQLTGRDNIALSGAIQGMSEAEMDARVGDIIDFSEVGDYIDQPVKIYSSGMYARLAYSVAAFMPAEIMLIDEVLSVGDANFSEKSGAHMKESLKDGRTVVYVGHGIDIVRELCTNALVLDEGRVAFSGTADDAASYYEEEVVSRARNRTPGQPQST